MVQYDEYRNHGQMINFRNREQMIHFRKKGHIVVLRDKPISPKKTRRLSTRNDMSMLGLGLTLLICWLLAGTSGNALVA